MTSFFRENECKQQVLRGVPVLDSIVFKLLSMAPGSSCNTSILPTVLLLRSLDRSTTNRSIIPISSKRKLIFFHFFPRFFLCLHLHQNWDVTREFGFWREILTLSKKAERKTCQFDERFDAGGIVRRNLRHKKIIFQNKRKIFLKFRCKIIRNNIHF